jgi:tetraacyldisaccharide 4'-kinase
VLAFCGIGRPGKFFATLEGLGADLAQTRAFPDHHAYTAEEARALMQDARSHGATLATTEKDLARLRRRGEPFETLLREARALPIRLDFSESDRTLLADLLRAAIDGRKAATRPAA